MSAEPIMIELFEPSVHVNVPPTVDVPLATQFLAYLKSLDLSDIKDLAEDIFDDFSSENLIDFIIEYSNENDMKEIIGESASAQHKKNVAKVAPIIFAASPDCEHLSLDITLRCRACARDFTNDVHAAATGISPLFRDADFGQRLHLITDAIAARCLTLSA